MKTLMIIVVIYSHSASVSNIEFTNYDSCILSTPAIKTSIKQTFSSWNQPEVHTSCVEVSK